MPWDGQERRMEYRLRIAPWARGISLRVTLTGAVEVVAPRRYSPRTIARLLRSEAEWIASAQAAVAERRRALPPPPAWELPPEISLPGVGARWAVATRPTAARGVRVFPASPGLLVVAGSVADPAACRYSLRRWLLREGQFHLPPRLASLSRGCGLPYARTTVRLARSRWGSCSRRGVISLNARLLLLPLALVDYVIVHELCHTREPNHSPAFWRLVERHCPTYTARRQELRAAGRRLPTWILDPGERSEVCTTTGGPSFPGSA
ncbi:MAG: M48 family peptidase [Zetaproteobacteria bacterium]|nr:MAG: M48 family peptidase [Zetaproteobacteria bacterium]